MTETDAPLPEGPSAEELRRALKAFKTRLKLTRLDDVSRLGRAPTSPGKESGIVAITPPHQYPQEVWNALVEKGKLRYAGQGLYEIVKQQ